MVEITVKEKDDKRKPEIVQDEITAQERGKTDDRCQTGGNRRRWEDNVANELATTTFTILN